MTTQPSHEHDLRQAIRAFASSSRFHLLKKLQVERLMPEGCGELGAVQELTFETLVELGSERIVKGMNLTPLQEASLVGLLLALSHEEVRDESTPEQALERHDELDSALPETGKPAPPEPYPLSSVQLELDLRQCLERLRNHDRYPTIRRTMLGTFWDPSWVSAPFEEALTIEQLAAMDLSVLFKKKMVNDSRISHMVMALERALRSLDHEHPQKKADAKTASVSRQQEPVLPRMTTLPSQWREMSIDGGTFEKAALELVVREASNPQSTALQSVLAAVLQVLSPTDFLAVVAGRDVSSNITRRLAMVATTVMDPHIVDLVRVSLQGPGTHIRIFAAIMAGLADTRGVLAELLAILAIRGLGAEPARYRGTLCYGYWTLSPGLLDELLGSRSARGGSRVGGSLRVDPNLLRLCQDQEGQEKRGKGKPHTRARRARRGK